MSRIYGRIDEERLGFSALSEMGPHDENTRDSLADGRELCCSAPRCNIINVWEHFSAVECKSIRR